MDFTIEAPQPAAAQAPSDPTPEDSGPQRWATGPDGHWWSAPQTCDRIPAGIYTCEHDERRGFHLARMRVDADDLLELPGSHALAILDEVRRFWQLEARFRAHGLIHKRGVLLHGPAGSGKTAVVRQVMDVVTATHGGVAIYVNHPGMAACSLQTVRRLEPHRPIAMVMEDLDALLHHHSEAQFLSLLDGETQVANVVFVATTNYPEKLDRRFTDRPSRFDLVVEVSMPPAEVRRAYLSARVPDLTPGDLDAWTDASEGFGFAHLRELVVLCRVYDYRVGDAVRRLHAMRSGIATSDRHDDGRRATTTGFR